MPDRPQRRKHPADVIGNAVKVVSALVLTGCAYATRSELLASSNAWGDCVMHEVARVDDGKTDPMSIAYGIEPACANLYDAVIQTALKGMITDEGQTETRRLYKDEELKDITAAVLTYRSSRAQH
jgi:hypothetical protein